MALVDLKSANLSQGERLAGIELGNDADGEARAAAVSSAGIGGVIAIEFPKFSDGRGFTQARLLREQFRFEGELRALGHAIPDQAIHFLRAGFDTVEIGNAGQLPHWQAALARYSGSYQTALRNPMQLRRDEARRRAETLDAELRKIDSLAARLELIAGEIPGRVAFSTSLGIEDQVVLHGIVEAGVMVDVFTLDTGRLFPETLEILAQSERHFGLRIRVAFPEASDVEDLVARDGVLGFRSSLEARKACCGVRKVKPLHGALADASGWITGLRAGQSATRADVPLVAWDEELGLCKVAPLGDWSLERIEAYVQEHAIPVNALHEQGFPSIGCQPCTRAISPGEDIRVGRWWWENEDNKECGLHTRPLTKGAAA